FSSQDQLDGFGDVRLGAERDWLRGKCLIGEGGYRHCVDTIGGAVEDSDFEMALGIGCRRYRMRLPGPSSVLKQDPDIVCRPAVWPVDKAFYLPLFLGSWNREVMRCCARSLTDDYGGGGGRIFGSRIEIACIWHLFRRGANEIDAQVVFSAADI